MLTRRGQHCAKHHCGYNRTACCPLDCTCMLASAAPVSVGLILGSCPTVFRSTALSYIFSKSAHGTGLAAPLWRCSQAQMLQPVHWADGALGPSSWHAVVVVMFAAC